MQTRRKFLGTAAGLPAAAFTAALSAAPDGGRIKKSILISMLPKELSYLDQFKLAVDAGCLSHFPCNHRSECEYGEL